MVYSKSRIALAALGSLLLASCALFRSEDASTTAYVGDSAITARVQMALIKDPLIKANEIEVLTSQGRVTLNGVVDNAAMARRALEVARATPGVRTIDDKMHVASDGEVSSTRSASSARSPDGG